MPVVCDGANARFDRLGFNVEYIAMPVVCVAAPQRRLPQQARHRRGAALSVERSNYVDKAVAYIGTAPRVSSTVNCNGACVCSDRPIFNVEYAAAPVVCNGANVGFDRPGFDVEYVAMPVNCNGAEFDCSG